MAPETILHYSSLLDPNKPLIQKCFLSDLIFKLNPQYSICLWLRTSHDLFNIMSLININNRNFNKHFGMKTILLMLWDNTDFMRKKVMWKFWNNSSHLLELSLNVSGVQFLRGRFMAVLVDVEYLEFMISLLMLFYNYFF